ncbi:MAG: DNA adenine methylase [Candidatus Omnitrophota bacterium]|nr:DNA adenine methylase [Candidatus Omnitrophota bacterium]
MIETTRLPSKKLEEAGRPVRLIQYLGSKLNVLDQIIPDIKSELPYGGTCVDLFAGTTVIGQSLTNHSSILSNDCLRFSRLFSDVLVVGPKDKPAEVPLPKLSRITESKHYSNNLEMLNAVYAEALAAEEAILRAGDKKGLGEFCETLPTWWKDEKHWLEYGKIRNFINELDLVAKRKIPSSFPACLFTTYYAGNYFGLKQAIEIDSTRFAVERLRAEGQLTDWQAKAVLVALIAASSRAVGSAGKHFAQPLIIHGSTQRLFALERVLSDRMISIATEMQAAMDTIDSKASPPRFPGKSFLVYFETLVDTAKKKGATTAFKEFFHVDRVDCIYADPPYTAQQYSRFYHVLETLVLYDYPPIQTHPLRSGGFTQGLYREHRHKSPFCSRSAAKDVFEALFLIASQVSNSLILSYSSTNNGSGNPRMIDTETILKLGKKYFREITEKTIRHRYRKLNREEKNKRGNDPEKLYIFRGMR